jgi:hypothetical protein
MFIQ